MKAGVGGLRLEAQDVAVGNVVGDGGEVALEVLRVGEFEVLAAGEVGYGLGDIALEAVGGGDGGHLGEGERWEELGEAVVGLDGFVVGGVGVRVGVFAHASVGRIWVVVFHPEGSGLSGKLAGGVMGGLGLAGGEADAVDGGVGVADGAEGFFEGEVAAAVEGFADEEDGAAVFGGLVAEKVDGEAESVEDGSAVVPEADVVDG